MNVIRKATRFAANAVFQMPPAFRLQQWMFGVPDVITREILAELESVQPRHDCFRVLDFGCGCGTYSGLFAPEHYLGVDSSERMLRWARRLHPGHTYLQAGDIDSIKSHVENVSHLMLIGVVHHLSSESVLSILSALPHTRPVHVLTIDALKISSGPGALIQLLERGEYLRTRDDYRALLELALTDVRYNEVPYGRFLRLAVIRGRTRVASGGDGGDALPATAVDLVDRV